uniref:Interferon alpha inducible protein 6 n=1 Tax=Sus scrofa TaxID=9823 RepID=A0A4X1U772_PIG
MKVLRNGMVAPPLGVGLSIRHRVGDSAPHSALSTLFPDKRRRSEDNSSSGLWGTLAYMAVGGGLMAMALPALGFTTAGIAANSVAASLMSWSAVANGGGVPAGGLVATLQSLGECRRNQGRRHQGQVALFTVLNPFHRLTQLSEVGILSFLF